MADRDRGREASRGDGRGPATGGAETGGPFAQRLRVAHLRAKGDTVVEVAPDADARARIATALGLLDLPECRLDGSIAPHGADAWRLDGRLTARVVQPCVVTLDPVETALSEEIRRIWSPHATAPTEEEAEMPDDEVEPLGAFVDVGAVMVEALSLALPTHPRAPGAELTPMPRGAEEAAEDDSQRRPFAGLADLLKREQ